MKNLENVLELIESAESERTIIEADIKRIIDLVQNSNTSIKLQLDNANLNIRQNFDLRNADNLHRNDYTLLMYLTINNLSSESAVTEYLDNLEKVLNKQLNPKKQVYTFNVYYRKQVVNKFELRIHYTF